MSKKKKLCIWMTSYHAKNETYVPNGISFFEMPCFFLPYDSHWWVPHEKEKEEKKTMPTFPMNLGDMTIILIIVKLSPQISNILCQNCHMTKYNIFQTLKTCTNILNTKLIKLWLDENLAPKTIT